LVAAKKTVKYMSPSVLVLIMIASVMLSAGLFYATGLLVGPGFGGGLPGGGGGIPDAGASGGLVETCALGFCEKCTTPDECNAVSKCEWRASPAGGIVISGVETGACYEKNVAGTSSLGMGVADPSKKTAIGFADLAAGVSAVEFEMKDYDMADLPSVSVTAKKLIGQPGGVSAPPGVPFKYYILSGSVTSGKGNFSKVKVNIVVDKAWITANNIDKNSLKVYRAVGTGFFETPTSTVLEGANSITLKGEADGFSYWAVSGQYGCTGAVTLSLLPQSASSGETVSATAGGLSNCGGKTIYVKAGSCGGQTACSIILSGSGGNCGFTAPEISGDNIYAACVDVDGDGSFVTGGETSTASIFVTVPAVQPNATAAVCGNGVCESGEDSNNCTADCPVIEQPKKATAEDALAAIKAANTAIADAQKANKDVKSATALYNEAITAYNAYDYETAKTKAEAALAAALGAQPLQAELPITFIVLAVVIIAALGGGAFYINKKGGFKFGKKAANGTAEPHVKAALAAAMMAVTIISAGFFLSVGYVELPGGGIPGGVVITDSKAPMWTSYSPTTGGQAGTSSTINLQAAWTDNNALKEAYLYTNESGSMAKVQTMALSGNSSTSSFSYKVPSLMNIAVGWYITASDTSNNLNSTPVATLLTVDATGPQCTLTQDTDVPDVNTLNTLKALCTDQSGVKTITLVTDEGGSLTPITDKYGSPASVTGLSGSAEFTWLNPAIAKGKIINWRVKAEDVKGNALESGMMSFTVGGGPDTKPPSLAKSPEFTTATPYTGTTVDIKASVTDNADLKRIWLVVGGKEAGSKLASGTSSEATFSWKAEGLGDVKWRVYAEDLAGNVYSSDEFVFTVLAAPAGIECNAADRPADRTGVCRDVGGGKYEKTTITYTCNSATGTWTQQSAQEACAAPPAFAPISIIAAALILVVGTGATYFFVWKTPAPKTPKTARA